MQRRGFLLASLSGLLAPLSLLSKRRTDQGQARKSLIIREDPSGRTIALWVTMDNTGKVTSTSKARALKHGLWHHVVIESSGDTLRVYVNGRKQC